MTHFIVVKNLSCPICPNRCLSRFMIIASVVSVVALLFGVDGGGLIGTHFITIIAHNIVVVSYCLISNGAIYSSYLKFILSL